MTLLASRVEALLQKLERVSDSLTQGNPFNSSVGVDDICETCRVTFPSLPKPQTVTKNDFKDCLMISQITQAFLTCFVFAPTLPRELPRGSPIPRFLHNKHT